MEVGSGGQFSPNVWPHNPTTKCRPPSATAEPFSHGTGTLQCLQKEMATYRRHWSVSLWRDPDDVSHCRILSPDKTEWRLISATLRGWRRCFVADQLWFMTRIREKVVGENDSSCSVQLAAHRPHNCQEDKDLALINFIKCLKPIKASSWRNALLHIFWLITRSYCCNSTWHLIYIAVSKECLADIIFQHAFQWFHHIYLLKFLVKHIIFLGVMQENKRYFLVNNTVCKN